MNVGKGSALGFSAQANSVLEEREVRLRVEAPLLVGAGFESQQVRTSSSVISGSTVRGAVARILLGAAGKLNFSIREHLGTQAGETPRIAAEAYTALFSPKTEEEAALFGPLFPVSAGKAVTADGWGVAGFPVPATAQTCKARKGFPSDGGDGVWDRLIHDIIRKEDSGPAKRQENPLRCVCGERLEHFRKTAVYVGEGQFQKAEPAKAFHTRVGLNRFTEAAEESILYSIEPLEASERKPLLFTGHWRMTKAQWEALQAGLVAATISREDGAQEFLIFVGGGRARGLGRAWLSWREHESPLGDVRRRIIAFNDKIAEKLAASEVPPSGQAATGSPSHLYFCFDVLAQTIVFDETGTPSSAAEARELERYLGWIPDGLEFMAELSTVEREAVSGWSMAWGMPKPRVSAIKAGSVLTYRVPVSPDGTLSRHDDERDAGREVLDDIVRFCEQVERKGLGERRAEGFGQVVVCHPFHVQLSW